MISLVIMCLLFLFSCKKKCIRRGNGYGIQVALYNGNNSIITTTIARQLKFYYFKPNGVADTFKASKDFPEIDVVRSAEMKIFTGDAAGIVIQGFTYAILNGEIQNNYLYLLFPDGITDSIKVQVRNVEGCDLNAKNYHIDGLLYNEQQAEFIRKIPVGNINKGINAFKTYIH